MKRKAKVFLAVLAVVALIAAASVWAAISKGDWSWAEIRSVCGHCGARRFEEWRRGVLLKDRIEEQPVTHWVFQDSPGHTQHTWARVSSESSRFHFRFFGRTFSGPVEHGCGGGRSVGTLYRIWKERETLGEDKAAMLLERYHALLHSGDRERMDEVWRSQEPLEALLPPTDQ